MTTTKKRTTLYITMVALFTALTFATTYFINIPTIAIFGAGGNINLGDTIIFIASILLGPIGGAIAGGIGASLADIVSSYAVYAPFTLVIKALAGALVGFTYHYIFKQKNSKRLGQLFAMSIGALVIVVGYYLTDVIILLIGGASVGASMVAGLLTILPNMLQVSISMVVAVVVMPRLFTAYGSINGIADGEKASEQSSISEQDETKE